MMTDDVILHRRRSNGHLRSGTARPRVLQHYRLSARSWARAAGAAHAPKMNVQLPKPTVRAIATHIEGEVSKTR